MAAPVKNEYYVACFIAEAGRKMATSDLPDFRSGIEILDVSDGAIVSGRVDSEEAVLVRRGEEFFAVGAQCTHYHGALAAGLAVGDTIRCPLHHACFSLRTGEALHAPAFDAIPCWRVERVGDRVFVREKLVVPKARHSRSGVAADPPPASVVIVGGAVLPWPRPTACAARVSRDR